MKPQLVEIEWLDARTYYERMKWSDIPARAKLSLQKTSGYLVHEDAERTIVAHTYDDEDEETEGIDITVVPSGWIKSIKRGGRKHGTSRIPRPSSVKES